MAIEDIGESLEGAGWWGVALGAVVLAPIVVPALARGLRPIAKEAVKGYLTLSEKAKEMMAESGEQWQDLVAEARSEYDLRHNGADAMHLDEHPEASEGQEHGEAEGPTGKRPHARRTPRPEPPGTEPATA